MTAMSKNDDIVLVDDEKHILSALRRALHSLGKNIICFTSPREALAYVKDNQPGIIISDQRMACISGTELLSQCHEIWPDTPCILLSAFHDFDSVAEAFNLGIIERYISKPWNDKELRFVVDKSLNLSSYSKSSDNVNISSSGNCYHGMLSQDDSMKVVFETIAKAATANVPVFITGETGTGKELVAQACHRESYRSKQPFIAVNCANFSENLMESQLFGHKKGSFTGAIKDQAGLFEVAAEGTIFLDEVTTIPIELQAKLLRVLQEREFTQLGDHKMKKFQAHVITASSTSLRDAVSSGQFRSDLFYRLNVIAIDLPPLRERGEDKLLLANHYLTKHCNTENKQGMTFGQSASDLISRYEWPGNIRQLENIVHSLIILSESEEIGAELLQRQLFGTSHRPKLEPKPLTELRPDVQQLSSKHSHASNSNTIEIPQHSQQPIQPLWLAEKIYIENAIEKCNGNIPKAAAILEVSASTLYRKIQNWKNL
jgi:DNA-binding NtrC family response regulator